MARVIKNINIPELVVKSYDTEDVVAFLTEKFKKYNSGENRNEELAMYIAILDELNKKLGGGNNIKVIM